MTRFAGPLVVAAVSVLALQQCSRAEPPAETADAELTPYFSVRELMQNIVDPTSDYIFEAVGADITLEGGLVEFQPETDEDWDMVRRGAVTIAEATNLLKMHRPIAPPEATEAENPGELSPPEIQEKVDANWPLFVSHVDELRDEAMAVLDIVNNRDVDALFDAGSDLDEACESCHLEFWYPGDREAVIRDRNSTVTYTTPEGEVVPVGPNAAPEDAQPEAAPDGQ